MTIPTDAIFFIETCSCGKPYKVYLDNFNKKNPFEFICVNCKRKMIFEMINNRTENDYIVTTEIDENLLDEIKL